MMKLVGHFRWGYSYLKCCCGVVHLSQNPAFNALTLHNNILKIVHAMIKSLVPFCSDKNGESTDMNCLVFWVYWKTDKFWQKAKSIIRVFSPFWWTYTLNISTTVCAMTKLSVPFCSAQDGESIDINCFVFWAHYKNGKILAKRQVYNKGILPILGNFS